MRQRPRRQAHRHEGLLILGSTRRIDDDDLTGEISRNAQRTRSAFIVSPDNKFRLVFNYPAAVGMNIAELLRSVECLQIARENDWLVVLLLVFYILPPPAFPFPLHLRKEGC